MLRLKPHLLYHFTDQAEPGLGARPHPMQLNNKEGEDNGQEQRRRGRVRARSPLQPLSTTSAQNWEKRPRRLLACTPSGDRLPLAQWLCVPEVLTHR